MSFSTVDEAERANNEMNGFVIEGKQIKVQKKKENYLSIFWIITTKSVFYIQLLLVRRE